MVLILIFNQRFFNGLTSQVKSLSACYVLRGTFHMAAVIYVKSVKLLLNETNTNLQI